MPIRLIINLSCRRGTYLRVAYVDGFRSGISVSYQPLNQPSRTTHLVFKFLTNPNRAEQMKLDGSPRLSNRTRHSVKTEQSFPSNNERHINVVTGSLKTQGRLDDPVSGRVLCLGIDAGLVIFGEISDADF